MTAPADEVAIMEPAAFAGFSNDTSQPSEFVPAAPHVASPKPTLATLRHQDLMDSQPDKHDESIDSNRNIHDTIINETGCTAQPASAMNTDPPAALPSMAPPPSPLSTSTTPTVADAAATDTVKCKKGSCIHGDRKSECRHCGGRAICEHGRRRRQCTTCRGSGICEHGKRKSRCRWCNGVGICQHQRLKSRCKECLQPGQNSQKENSQQENSQKEAILTLPHASLTKLFLSLPETVIAAIAPKVRLNKSPQQLRQIKQQREASAQQPQAGALPKTLDAPRRKNISKPVFGDQPATLDKGTARLATFIGWPHSDIPIKPFVRAGFIFQPTPSHPDQCKCFSCHKLFANWKRGDDPTYVHKAVNPHCPFILSLTSPANCETVRTSSTTTAIDAASVSALVNTSATPATKKKARDSVTPNVTSEKPPQKKVKKMPSLTGPPMNFYPQLATPMLPMAHALGMMPLFMRAQQCSALFQSQVSQEQAAQQQLMQPYLYDPSMPLLFDSTQAFPSLLPTDLSALYPGLSPFDAMQLGAGLSTYLSSFGANPV